MIRRSALAVVIALISVPATAQETGEGRSLMERGVELFFEGLRQELSPAMEDLRKLAEQAGPSMRSFLTEMGPAFAEMLDEVQDWTSYYPPEMLPNGDIILRRKTPPAPEPEDLPPAGPTDI